MEEEEDEVEEGEGGRGGTLLINTTNCNVINNY